MDKNLAEILTDPNNLFAAVVAVAFFAAIITLAAPYMRGGGLEARLKAVANRREELRRKSREALSAKSSTNSLRQTDEGLYKRVVERLQLGRFLEDDSVADKLAQAGFRGPKPISTYYFFRFITPFVLALVAGVYIFFINDFGLALMAKGCVCFVAYFAGFYAPSLYITNIAQKRRGSIVAAFPDCLDLLLICVESGMSIEAALQKVSTEIGGASMELAEELSLLTAELLLAGTPGGL